MSTDNELRALEMITSAWESHDDNGIVRLTMGQARFIHDTLAALATPAPSGNAVDALNGASVGGFTAAGVLGPRAQEAAPKMESAEAGWFVEAREDGEFYVGTTDGMLGCTVGPPDEASDLREQVLYRIATTPAAAQANTEAAPRGGGEAPVVSISLPQAQALVDYFGGDNTTVDVYEFDEGRILDDDDSPMPAGLYAVCAECPEEGATYLGPFDPDTEAAPPAAQPHDTSTERGEADAGMTLEMWRNAYHGARQDLAIWKRRAIDAEAALATHKPMQASEGAD